MQKDNQNFILALVLLTFVMVLFSVIVWRQLGGETTLGVIIGHVAAWIQMAILYYFRKKPPQKPPPSP